MGTFSFTGTVVDDVELTFNLIGTRRYREGQTHVVPIGTFFEQSTPATLAFSVSESDANISNVGLRYGNSGAFNSSVTLTPTQAAMLDDLELQFTVASVTADTTFSFTITAGGTDYTFEGTIVNDVALVFNLQGTRKYREGETHEVPIGTFFTQGTPLTLTFAVSETSTHISNVGLRYGSSGNWTSSVTLTEAQAAQAMLESNLNMRFTCGAVDQDQAFTITITTTDP